MEIIPRGQDAIADDYKQMITRIVEEKVLEAMTDRSAGDFQPFFQPGPISDEIRRRQTVHEQRKFTYTYQDWGCLCCGTTDRPHRSLWMCGKCYNRAKTRLLTSLRRRAKEHEGPDSFQDAAEEAQRALLPSIKALAKRRGK